MLSISTNKLKYYLYVKPTDMRKSFDGLIGLVQNNMELDYTGGDVFILYPFGEVHIDFLNEACN
ncbi:IS66 family insertion sequence element accessory protein TnpB [Calditrichota bacterium LG25]